MSFVLVIPVIGAVALAVSTVFEKILLGKKKIDIKSYHVAAFLAVVIAMLPFIYFFWGVDSHVLSLANILILALIVVFSTIANILMFYSIKWEKIGNLEPAWVLEPLLTIIISLIFYFILGNELFKTDSKIFLPAIIAGAALFFSHIRKHHLNFNKYFMAAILSGVFFSLELTLSRLLLEFYTPLSFYFIRCILIFAISFLIFRPNLGKVPGKIKLWILGMGFLWVGYRVMVYYGYISLGIVFTTLMLMLGPIFVYIFAWKFLKEKLDWRNIAASAIIVGSVLYILLG